jgi:hypothetical protein
MKRAPTVVALTACYLALAGGALLAWLAWPGQPVPLYAVTLCAAPLLVLGVIAARARRDPKGLVLGSFAWALFAPILLLMWGASSELPPPAAAVEPSAHDELDAGALSAGSIAAQQVPSTHPEVREQRAYAFADGSELRCTRFVSVAAAARYLEFVRSTFAGSAFQLAERRGLRAHVGGSDRFVYWERHGRTLLELQAADEGQALSRLRAQGVPMPAAGDDLPAPASVAARRVWPFALGYSLVHAFAVFAFVVWAGAATTRVDAAPGTRPVLGPQLLARLDALGGLAIDCAVTPGASENECIVELNTKPDSARAHRLTLSVDARRSLVLVREYEGAFGAAPRDAGEADMRAPGEIGIDPARPRARKVWASKLQVTIIDTSRLAGMELGLDGDALVLPVGVAGQLDATGTIHLICALVTRSGFAWQPIFFGFQGQRRMPL